jgi:hypothetical protein
VCDCHDWTAFRDEMPRPGSDGTYELRVSGTCTCNASGAKISLEPGNAGTPGDPTEVVLRCVVIEPDIGSPVVTETPVNWVGPVGRKATRVRIDGDCSAQVPIEVAS